MNAPIMNAPAGGRNKDTLVYPCGRLVVLHDLPNNTQVHQPTKSSRLGYTQLTLIHSADSDSKLRQPTPGLGLAHPVVGYQGPWPHPRLG